MYFHNQPKKCHFQRRLLTYMEHGSMTEYMCITTTPCMIPTSLVVKLQLDLYF